MTHETDGSPQPAAKSVQESAFEAARQMLRLLESKEPSVESHRKAALRRVIHNAVVGFTAAEVGDFLEDLHKRFPAGTKEPSLGPELEKLKSQVRRLTREQEQLAKRVADQLAVLEALRRCMLAESDAVLDAGAVTRYFEGVSVVVDFAVKQEKSFAEVMSSLRGRGPSTEGPSVRELLGQQVVAGHGEDVLEEIQRRLTNMAELPLALLLGAQDSWDGTHGVLVQLDPRDLKSRGALIPFWGQVSKLRECQQRFAQFWDHYAANVEFYYRRKFVEKVLMLLEGRS